jgi:hypothetical protein
MRSCALRADIDDICTFSQHAFCLPENSIGIITSASIVERIGRNIDDTHHQRMLRWYQFSPAIQSKHWLVIITFDQ